MARTENAADTFPFHDRATISASMPTVTVFTAAMPAASRATVCSITLVLGFFGEGPRTVTTFRATAHTAMRGTIQRNERQARVISGALLERGHRLLPTLSGTRVPAACELPRARREAVLRPLEHTSSRRERHVSIPAEAEGESADRDAAQTADR